MINIQSIKERRPFRMDTQRYHRELAEKKRATTEKLKQEILNKEI